MLSCLEPIPPRVGERLLSTGIIPHSMSVVTVVLENQLSVVTILWRGCSGDLLQMPVKISTGEAHPCLGGRHVELETHTQVSKRCRLGDLRSLHHFWRTTGGLKCARDG